MRRWRLVRFELGQPQLPGELNIFRRDECRLTLESPDGFLFVVPLGTDFDKVVQELNRNNLNVHDALAEAIEWLNPKERTTNDRELD